MTIDGKLKARTEKIETATKDNKKTYETRMEIPIMSYSMELWEY